MKYKLTVYDEDGAITYQSNDASEIIRQIENIESEPQPEPKPEPRYTRPLSPYERRRNQVYATGNRWAIENWNATHN